MKTKLTAIILALIACSVMLLAQPPTVAPIGTQHIQMRDRQTHQVINEGFFKKRGTTVVTKEWFVYIYSGGTAGVLTVWSGFEFEKHYITINQ